MARSRSRSRSPRRSTHRSRTDRGGGGFRWKDKASRVSTGAGQERGLDRGYRGREQEDYRQRNDERERRKDGEDVENRREGREVKEPRRKDEKKNTNNDQPQSNGPRPDNDIIAKFGASATTSAMAPITSSTTTSAKAPPSKPPTRSVPTGPMIVVKINDRLGTTSKVPCLPSDSIGDLKKLVAMRIGRKPHEIMLKRQSERPFKDFLTLEDYGIGDGVQLDLELDTGD